MALRMDVVSRRTDHRRNISPGFVCLVRPRAIAARSPRSSRAYPGSSYLLVVSKPYRRFADDLHQVLCVNDEGAAINPSRLLCREGGHVRPSAGALSDGAVKVSVSTCRPTAEGEEPLERSPRPSSRASRRINLRPPRPPEPLDKARCRRKESITGKGKDKV